MSINEAKQETETDGHLMKFSKITLGPWLDKHIETK
jgi:hypothetical protein